MLTSNPSKSHLTAYYNKIVLCCRDVSGVELLMNNHQSLKAEIDTREDNFAACISLGKELLARNHYDSNGVCHFITCSFMRLLQFCVFFCRSRKNYCHLPTRETDYFTDGKSAGRICSSVSLPHSRFLQWIKHWLFFQFSKFINLLVMQLWLRLGSLHKNHTCLVKN